MLSYPANAALAQMTTAVPVRRPPVAGIVTDDRQWKGRCGITQPRRLVHRARMTTSPGSRQIRSYGNP